MDKPMEQIKNVEAAIEAILYAAGHPIAYSKLSEVLGLSEKDTKKMVAHMAEEYSKEGSGRGIMLLTFDDSCQLATKEVFATYIREALGIRRGGNLSASSMEVLSIVAYNQPVTRTYIDTIRGVDSNYSVNSLIDKELIVAVGRLDAPGRPTLYGTSEKFLRVFGLSSLDDLPETELMTMNVNAEGEVDTTQMTMEIPNSSVIEAPKTEEQESEEQEND